MTLEAKFFSARLLGRGSVQTRPGCADQKGFLAALEMTDWSPLSSRTKDLSLPISFSGIWQESDTQRISLNRSRASEVSVIPLWKRVAGRDFLLPCASIVPENSRFETKKLPHTTIKLIRRLSLSMLPCGEERREAVKIAPQCSRDHPACHVSDQDQPKFGIVSTLAQGRLRDKSPLDPSHPLWPVIFAALAPLREILRVSVAATPRCVLRGKNSIACETGATPT